MIGPDNILVSLISLSMWVWIVDVLYVPMEFGEKQFWWSLKELVFSV